MIRATAKKAPDREQEIVNLVSSNGQTWCDITSKPILDSCKNKQTKKKTNTAKTKTNEKTNKGLSKLETCQEQQELLGPPPPPFQKKLNK